MNRDHFIRAYKETLGCARCLEHRAECLQFHHIEPLLRRTRGITNKLREVSTLVAKRSSPGRIVQEIAHCELLCANCHCVETARIRGWGFHRNPSTSSDAESAK